MSGPPRKRQREDEGASDIDSEASKTNSNVIKKMHFNSDAEKGDSDNADNNDGNSGDEESPNDNIVADQADLNEITMNAIESTFLFFFQL